MQRGEGMTRPDEYYVQMRQELREIVEHYIERGPIIASTEPSISQDAPGTSQDAPNMRRNRNLDKKDLREYLFLFGLKDDIRKREENKLKTGKGIVDNYVSKFINLIDATEALQDLLQGREQDIFHEEFYSLDDPQQMLDHCNNVEKSFIEAEDMYMNYYKYAKDGEKIRHQNIFKIDSIRVRKPKFLEDLELTKNALSERIGIEVEKSKSASVKHSESNS